MKAISIIGTRADIIKMSPLIKTLNESKKITHSVLFTQQHMDMGRKKIEEFNLKVHHEINKKQQLKEAHLYFLIKEIKVILKNNYPDIVLVHGDTLTAVSGAIAAHECNIRICHVEAGLRTNNIYSPYPEEINRIIISRLAYHHYCPTKKSYANLLAEDIDKKKIFLTGNTIVDVVKNSKLEQKNNNGKINILVTTHRRETWDTLPTIMCSIINKIIIEHENVTFTILSHPNNKIYSVYKRKLLVNKNIFLLQDCSHKECLNLIYNSSFIATDSCGIQEEASVLGKPIIILRNETERPESIEYKYASLSTTNEDKIYSILQKEIINNTDQNKNRCSLEAFGDGNTSIRIKNIIESIDLSEKS